MVNLKVKRTILESHPHEYAAIQIYRNKKLTDSLNCSVRSFKGENIFLLDRFADKGYPKVLLICFMSEWCPNCYYEAPIIDEIYTNHEDLDFEVIVVVEYSDSLEWENCFVTKLGLKLPYVYGELSEKNEDRKGLTSHHRIKTFLNDKRKWGVPLHLIIISGKLDEVYCVKGEFEPKALEGFLTNQLT